MAKRKINKKLVAKNNSTKSQRKEAERRANARQDKPKAKKLESAESMAKRALAWEKKRSGK